MNGLSGTWAYDLQTSSFTWSPEMFLIFDRDPLTGTPSVMEFCEYIHLADRFHWELFFNKLTHDGVAAEINLKIYRTEGTRRIKKSARGVYEGQRLISLHGSCVEF